MILRQTDRDDAVSDLLQKLSEVYAFMNEDGRVAEIQFMQAPYGKIARQTLECADFTVNYSETKSACELNMLSPRLTLNAVSLYREKTRQEHLQRDYCHDSELQ